ncbi:hypothetical protein [Hoeflea sp.]|uniref:hypothetical protein n=1 Tax=Hoeflea sp. TaxID=1940281 RepID=UPI0019C8BBAE|nr:hypothetical protein [Hoeflea sp.]MBC7280777.1 hypothetical protein [Hoeflea sp.]
MGIGIVAVPGLFIPPASAGPDCECVGNGRKVKEGSVICLQVGSSQRYLARCERVLNNTSWKKISDGCPTAQTSPRADMTVARVPG